MTWTKIDDRFAAHPKVQRAWQQSRGSIGLHVLALSHAGAYLTDGHVSEAFVRTQLPGAAERRKAVGALVDSGLWERNGDEGWVIHDFLDCNPSAADLKVKRDWDNSRKGLERDRELVGAIKDRDDNRCRYCAHRVNWKDRKGPRGGTYDHVMPRGPNTLENVVVACRACNQTKGGRTPEEAGLELLDPPGRESGSSGRRKS